MDKYLHLQLLFLNHYKWFDYMIVELPKSNTYGLFKNVFYPPGVTMVSSWVSLEELDEKLEQLWQKHQSKSEVEA